MADGVPFLGLEDLREILTAVLLRKATAVRECRPLKVTNYLQVRETLEVLRHGSFECDLASLCLLLLLLFLLPKCEFLFEIDDVSIYPSIYVLLGQGEAVRLARQLPANLSREDVEETLRRMEEQLSDGGRTCIHGRPFFHHLADVPDSQEEAEGQLRRSRRSCETEQ